MIAAFNIAERKVVNPDLRRRMGEKAMSALRVLKGYASL